MKSIWKKDVNIDEINRFSKGSIVKHLGITFTQKGDNFLKATMPVDERTIQPLGFFHGGALAVLAETLGRMAFHLTLDDSHFSVGQKNQSQPSQEYKERAGDRQSVAGPLGKTIPDMGCHH